MKKELKDAANAVEDASNSRALVIAARAGFAVSGLLHLLIGFVAIQLALGKAGQADQAGAVAQLAAQPQGLLLLWTGFAACVALALWQTSNAVFDTVSWRPERRSERSFPQPPRRWCSPSWR